MNWKIEDIAELNMLSPPDRELVIKAYRREELPFHIELKVMAPAILVFLVFFLQLYLELDFGLNTFEIVLTLVIITTALRLFLDVIEYTFIAPRIIRKLIKNLNGLKGADDANTIPEGIHQR